MTNKPSRTLQEMAAASNGGGLKCPNCGCQNFKTYGGSRGERVVVRYKSCRHCGHRILTSTESRERIIRDVNPHEKEDDGDEGDLLQFG